MAEDPVTRLLKFANFATGQIRHIIRLGKRTTKWKRVKKANTANHTHSYRVKEERNTCDQDHSEDNSGNVDSKSVSHEKVMCVSNQQEGSSVKHKENHFFEVNFQDINLECSQYGQDPVNLAVQAEWPNYTDRSIWCMGAVEENVNLQNYTPTITEILDNGSDKICFQHNSDADGYYESVYK
jgi:hypothetical protein